MHICSSGHKYCNRPSLGKRLPLRLLDLDPDDLLQALPKDNTDLNRYSVDEVSGVQIRLTDSLPKDVEYLTLSHRWDPAPSILLTSDTARLLSTRIPLRLLQMPSTKTIREAIQVTRTLGYRYLWVDALCIMQDDTTEKVEAIALMDEFYVGAVANISATGASRATDGLFHQRSPLIMQPCSKTVYSCSDQRRPVANMVAQCHSF